MRTSAPQAPALATAAAAGLIAVVAGCGGGGSSAPSTTAASATATTAAATTRAARASAVDPCSLLTDTEVAKLGTGLGHGTLQTITGTRLCEWSNAHGLPAVQLQVTKDPDTSLEQELGNLDVGNSGYTIVAVAGIGDAAAAAFQKAGLAPLHRREAARLQRGVTPARRVTRARRR